MDIMKTLLIYLSATMAFAVQSTSAPKETPTPSPEPVAVIETLAPDAEETGTVVEATALLASYLEGTFDAALKHHIRKVS